MSSALTYLGSAVRALAIVTYSPRMPNAELAIKITWYLVGSSEDTAARTATVFPAGACEWSTNYRSGEKRVAKRVPRASQ
jgi:hypothetical protein